MVVVIYAHNLRELMTAAKPVSGRTKNCLTSASLVIARPIGIIQRSKHVKHESLNNSFVFRRLRDAVLGVLQTARLSSVSDRIFDSCRDVPHRIVATKFERLIRVHVSNGA